MPYVGEIRMMANLYCPNGWEFCEGQLLPISENDVLFTLLGTQYGGDGVETFGLPDLRGRVPIHRSGSHPQSEMGGVEYVTLTTGHLPNHSHRALGSAATATSVSPAGNVYATLSDAGVQSAYGEDEPFLTLPATMIAAIGGSQPHENRQPYGVLNYVISLYGVIPDRP